MDHKYEISNNNARKSVKTKLLIYILNGAMYVFRYYP